jgi:2,4-dienoyl-CoA reductase-like NADH-dependent reductase (Old Yellow Enzyme family)
MNEAEIRETIDGLQAARRAKDAGFDGVEVWAADIGMVDQFWTPGATGATINGSLETARGCRARY